MNTNLSDIKEWRPICTLPVSNKYHATIYRNAYDPHCYASSAKSQCHTEHIMDYAIAEGFIDNEMLHDGGYFIISPYADK